MFPLPAANYMRIIKLKWRLVCWLLLDVVLMNAMDVLQCELVQGFILSTQLAGEGGD
jgi:hypothetical protein